MSPLHPTTYGLWQMFGIVKYYLGKQVVEISFPPVTGSEEMDKPNRQTQTMSSQNEDRLDLLKNTSTLQKYSSLVQEFCSSVLNMLSDNHRK